MGVPGFFMWLWKKYKGTNFVFDKDHLNNKKDNDLIKIIKNIDYFLIDTNCLIHPECFRILAEYNNITDQNALEEKMMNAVIQYLHKLVNYVEPKKGVYIAIDGVAPAGKIKQQRSRRFKSVHDRKMYENIKKKYKKEIPNSWNNSAISPGTEFMEKLNEKILIWCKNQKLEIIYSSSNTPAEGEHKLLQFIRDNKKEKKDFKYVVYGLVADLLFLALTTGLDNVFLLREAVHLNKNKPTDVLNYVWIKKMKDSITDTIEDIIKIDYDLEKKLINKQNLINDFIFICYLLGNDFLPHLPSLNISKNGLDYLLELYVKNLVKNKYEYMINLKSKEIINQKIFNQLIDKLAEEEDNIISEMYSKKKKRYPSNSNDPYEKELHKIENLMFKINDPIKLGSDKSELWEKRYYNHYFHTEDNELDDFKKNISEQYLIGLKWVTMYYFQKCPAWKWYFPYDHPPFLKDVAKHSKNFKFKDIKFELGKPLKPFEQLLCILPPQSAFLLPKLLRRLMENPNSSLSHLYPTDFEQDFIGKGRYWMGIPYLPSLELDLVQKIYKKYDKKIFKNDKKRNKNIKNYYFNID